MSLLTHIYSAWLSPRHTHSARRQSCHEDHPAQQSRWPLTAITLQRQRLYSWIQISVTD